MAEALLKCEVCRERQMYLIKSMC